MKMKKHHHEAIGKFISWLCWGSIKFIGIILIFVLISSVMYEGYTNEIKWEVWSAFETQYELDIEEFRNQHGIIDEDQGIINFWDQQAEPVSI